MRKTSDLHKKGMFYVLDFVLGPQRPSAFGEGSQQDIMMLPEHHPSHQEEVG